MNENKLRKIFNLYFSSVLIYSLALLLFHKLPYYKNLLGRGTLLLIDGMFLVYLALAPIYYYFKIQPDSENKPYIILKLFGRNINSLINGNQRLLIYKKEKIALLFFLVKLFFIPIMYNFAISNLNSLKFDLFNAYWYPLVLTFLFTLDTIIFAFGYSFEFKSLKNVVRSVEPTIFGWAVALVCYPPFNQYIGSYVPWGASEYVKFSNPNHTLILQIVVVFLLIIYTWASVALGPKASNLTNRGIVSKFPYSIVRHPAYICKVTMWWITLIPVINLSFFMGMFFWTLIYFFRAITEERHLIKDQDYVEYCKKVKWKFIPGVY